MTSSEKNMIQSKLISLSKKNSIGNDYGYAFGVVFSMLNVEQLEELNKNIERWDV